METPLSGLDLRPLPILLMLVEDPALETDLSSDTLGWGEGAGEPLIEIESIVLKNFSENS